MFAARAGRVVLDIPWNPSTRAGLQTKINAAPESKVMAEHRKAREFITPFYPFQTCGGFMLTHRSVPVKFARFPARTYVLLPKCCK